MHVDGRLQQKNDCILRRNQLPCENCLYSFADWNYLALVNRLQTVKFVKKKEMFPQRGVSTMSPTIVAELYHPPLWLN